MIVLNRRGRFEFTPDDPLMVVNNSRCINSDFEPTETIYGYGNSKRLSKILYADRCWVRGGGVTTSKWYNFVSDYPPNQPDLKSLSKHNYDRVWPRTSDARLKNSSSLYDMSTFIYRFSRRRGGWVCIAVENRARALLDLYYGNGSACEILDTYFEEGDVC